MEMKHQIHNVSIYTTLVKEKLRGKFVATNGYFMGGKKVKINELTINLKIFEKEY